MKFEIDLIRGQNEAPMFSNEYQTELRTFSKQTQPSSQTALAMDSAFGGGGPLGEYTFEISKNLITTLAPALVAYIAGKVGRKVKLKVDSVEIEARSVEEVEKLMDVVQKYRDAEKSPNNDSNDSSV